MENKQNIIKGGTTLALRAIALSFIIVTLFWSSVLFLSNKSNAATGINEQINYQGRLLTNTGAVVPDGTYNMEFKIYQDGDGVLGGGDETLKWTETRTSGNKVTVKNGYFSVYLGSVTAFGSSVDWNQNVLWLSINIGGTGTPSWDGEMSPFTRFGSTPYSLNSKALGGLTSSNFVQLAQGVQTDSSTTNSSVYINKTGATANILQIQRAGSDVFVVANDGSLTMSNNLSVNGTITMGDASSDGIILNGEVRGASPLAFEGATNDDIRTIFAITDPTISNKTITFPNSSGYVILDTQFSGDISVNSSGLVTISGDAIGASEVTNGSLTNLDLSSSAGITNGQLANSSISFALGTTGSDANWSSSPISLGGTATLNLPDAGSGARGLVNTGSQTFAGGKTFSSAIAANGGITFDNSTDTVGAHTLSGNIDANNNLITNIGNSGTDFTSGGGLTLAGDIVANGIATFQSTTASTSAFQVQNTSGLDVINVSTATTANLVSNPSFETGTNGWSKKGNASVAVSSSDEVTAQFGSRELKIVTTANANDGATFNFTPTASTADSITFWAKSTASFCANCSGGHRENTTTGDVDCLTGQTLTTTWTQFTCTNYSTNITVNDTSPTIGIYVKQSDATARTIYIDGVTMVQATTAQNFDIGGSVLDLQSLGGGLTINSTNTGDLQSWQTNNTTLNAGTGLRHSSSTVSNGYIYNIGGCTGACGVGTAVTTVQYAKISNSGAVGVWSTTTVLPSARYGHTSFQANGYLYVIGGDTGAGAFGANPQNTVYFAKLNSDGTLGTWQTSINTLPATREFHTSVFNGGFAYVIGGDSAGAQSTVYYAKIYADGSTGVWTSTTALTTGAAARRYASSVFANGYLYVIGGDTGGTAQSNVYFNSVNADGTLGVSWASTTSLTNARRYLSSVVANGYVYAIGGDNGTSAQTSVYYSKLLADGNVGAWNSASSLSVGRYGHTSSVINGYVYTIGGYDGSNASAGVMYATTLRTLIGGTLDLIGLSSQYLSDPGGAGAIVAGNVRAIGGLQVEGFADINGGLSVDSALNINAVSADAGQVVLNINNSSSNSIFNVRHMSANFGSLATGGAFIDNNSSYVQDFMSDVSATSTNDSVNVGDDLNWYADLSTILSTESWSQTDQTNGFVRLSTGTTSGRGILLGFGAAQNNLSLAFVKANLPVLQMKVRTNINNATNDLFWGFMDQATAPTANDTKPANGMYFWNNNAGGAWQGVVRNGAADVGTVTCPGAVSTTQFAVGRIQVESTTSVRFLIDNDSSDGINLIDCGVVSGANPAGALGIAAYTVHTETTGRNFDIDYVKVWQDDNIPSDSSASVSNSVSDNDALAIDNITMNLGSDRTSSMVLADLMSCGSNDCNSIVDSSNGRLIAGLEVISPAIVTDKITANSITTGDDQLSFDLKQDGRLVVNDTDGNTKISMDSKGNANFAGTLTADKIKANQIEGLEIFVNQIASLSANQQNTNSPSGNDSQQATSSPNQTVTSLQQGVVAQEQQQGVDLNNLVIQKASVTLDLNVAGAINIGGPAEFRGNTIFYKLVTFVEKTVFKNDVRLEGRVTFNNDTAGYAVIPAGQDSVRVNFASPYETNPVVTVSVKNGQFVQYSYRDLSANGFTIVVPEPAVGPIEFSWIALDVQSPRTSQGQ